MPRRESRCHLFRALYADRSLAFRWGVSAGTKYGETAFQLPAGDRPALLTDGVVEARNVKGELFGFERAAELVQQSRTANEIAAEGQQLSRHDNITVVTVIRMQ